MLSTPGHSLTAESVIREGWRRGWFVVYVLALTLLNVLNVSSCHLLIHVIGVIFRSKDELFAFSLWSIHDCT